MQKRTSMAVAVLVSAVSMFVLVPGPVIAQVTSTDGDSELFIDVQASSEQVLSGSNVTYTITVNNEGTDAAPAFVVTDALPAETTFVSCDATGGGVCGGSGTS